MNGTKIIVAFVCGFVVAQLIKIIIAVLKGQKNLKDYITKSGGMPSGHAASFTAATINIGLIEGFQSSVFMLAVCVALIIFYDAANVRYAVGRQGKALNKLISEPLKVIEGHTVIEVFAGIVLGVLIGMGIFYIF